MIWKYQVWSFQHVWTRSWSDWSDFCWFPSRKKKKKNLVPWRRQLFWATASAFVHAFTFSICPALPCIACHFMKVWQPPRNVPKRSEPQWVTAVNRLVSGMGSHLPLLYGCLWPRSHPSGLELLFHAESWQVRVFFNARLFWPKCVGRFKRVGQAESHLRTASDFCHDLLVGGQLGVPWNLKRCKQKAMTIPDRSFYRALDSIGESKIVTPKFFPKIEIYIFRLRYIVSALIYLAAISAIDTKLIVEALIPLATIFAYFTIIIARLKALQAHYIAAAEGTATKGFLMYETQRLGFSTASIIVLAVDPLAWKPDRRMVKNMCLKDLRTVLGFCKNTLPLDNTIRYNSMRFIEIQGCFGFWNQSLNPICWFFLHGCQEGVATLFGLFLIQLAVRNMWLGTGRQMNVVA